MYGLHYNDTFAGRVFSQTVTPLGLAIPIYTATGLCGAGICGLPLWNPPGSGVEIEMIQYDINYGSGTADYGALVVMAMPLNAVATAELCTAAVWSTPVNARLGSGANSAVRSYNGASTFTITAGGAGAPSTAGPGVVRSVGNINLEAVTGTAHSASGFTIGFNGTLSIKQGWMTYLACTKASVALYCAGMIWKEIPN